MNQKAALNTILNQTELNEAWNVLDSDKESSRLNIKNLLDNVIRDIKQEKKIERRYFCRLLELAYQFQVRDVDLLLSLIERDEYLMDSKGLPIITSLEYGNAIAQSVSSSDDLVKIESYYFSKNLNGFGKESAFYALQIYYSFLTRRKPTNNLELIESEDEPQNKLVDFYFRIIDEVKTNIITNVKHVDPGTNGHILWNVSYSILLLIADDSIQHDYYYTPELKNALVSGVVQFITASGTGFNDSIFKKYFRILKLLSPRDYCKAADAEDFIRKLWRNLHKENIFSAHSLEEAGRVIFDRTKAEVNCADDIVKIGVQMLNEWPFNNRTVPISDNDYYRTLAAYFEIAGVPWNAYKIVRDGYDKVRAEYEMLVERINLLEAKCEELKNASDVISTKIKEKQRKKILSEDVREDKFQLLEGYRSEKNLTRCTRKKQVLRMIRMETKKAWILILSTVRILSKKHLSYL